MHINTHLWKYIQHTGAEQLHFMFQVRLLIKDVSRELHKLGDDCWLRAKLTFSFEL